MKEQKLSWHARGRLWFRIGVRLVLLAAGLWLLWKVGLPLLSLMAPFVAALITAAILHPVVRRLKDTLGGSRKLWSMLVLVLLFGLLGAAVGGLAYAAGAQMVSLVQSWDDLLKNLEGIFGQLEQLFARFWDLVPPALNETVASVWDSVLKWLQTTLPKMLEGVVAYAKDKALSLPSLGLALIIYVMAAYLLTADYPDLRTAAAQRTDRRLLAFLVQVRDTALAAFGGYLKAEFLLSVGVFFILLGGFFIIRQPYGLLLALVLAVMDFIPIIGAGTVMVPWAVIDLFTGNIGEAIQLMVIWGLIALFRRVGEPKFVGDQTGLSPILSLISIYVGMRLGGVLGMILGPTVALIALNLIKLGLFDGVRADAEAAVEDVIAILRERPEDESKEQL